MRRPSIRSSSTRAGAPIALIRCPPSPSTMARWLGRWTKTTCSIRALPSFLSSHRSVSTVETERWDDRSDGSTRIEQVIFVQRPSQRAIVLGEGGQRIKAIGARARAELERMLGRRIHLFLFVKVRENWVDDRERYAALGLEYDV